MIKSPYDALGVRNNPDEEQVLEGEFQCQTCYAVSDRAAYFAGQTTLAWVCPNMHHNEIEGFEPVD